MPAPLNFDAILKGSPDSDTLEGSPGNDILKGGPDNDILKGFAGNDILKGGTGDDSLEGGAGNDLLKAGAGNDHIGGGAGNDIIDAGTGQDVINEASEPVGDRGIDTIDLGAGGSSKAATGQVTDPDFLKGGVVVGELPKSAKAPNTDEVDIAFDNSALNDGSGFITDPGGAVKISNYVAGQDDIDLQNIGNETFDGELVIFGDGGTDDTEGSGNNDETSSDKQAFYNINLDSSASQLSGTEDLFDETSVLNELEQANGEGNLDGVVDVSGDNVFDDSAEVAGNEFGFLIHGPDDEFAAYRGVDANTDGKIEIDPASDDQLNLVGVAYDGGVLGEFGISVT